mmetsp:Transcript_7834/g.17451  ORF Transcript_7834/g.17451 Transcript_7834/m.17451 type:complete len:823 (+) Transcript_7834:145-2613(+)
MTTPITPSPSKKDSLRITSSTSADGALSGAACHWQKSVKVEMATVMDNAASASPHRVECNVNDASPASTTTEHEQEKQYERTIRRALLENEYVRKINAKLVLRLDSLSVAHQSTLKEHQLAMAKLSSEHQNTVDKLHKQQQRLTMENATTHEDMHKLKSICESSKDLMKSLNGSKLLAERRVVELEKEVEGLKRGNAALETTVLGLRESLLEASTNECAKVDEEERRIRSVLEEKVTELRVKLETMAAVDSARGDGGARAEKVLDEMKCKMNQLEGEKIELQKEVAALTKEKQDCNAKMNVAVEELGAVTAERDIIKDHLARAAESTKEELINTRTSLNDVTTECDVLLVKLEELSIEKDASDQKLHDVTREKDLLREQLNVARESAEAECECLSATIESLQTDLLNSRKGQERLVLAMESAAAQHKELKGKVNDLEADAQDLRTRENVLKTELDDAKSEIATLKESVGEKNNTISCLKEDLETMAQQHEEMVLSKQSLYDDELARNRELSLKLKALSDEKDETEAKVEVFSEELASAVAALVEFQQTLSSGEEELNETKNRLDLAEKQLEDAALEKEGLKQQVEQLSSEIAEHDTLMGGMMKEWDDAEASTKELQLQNESNAAEWKQEEERLQQLVSSLQTNCNESNERLTVVSSKYKALKAKVAILKKLAVDQKDEMDNVRSQRDIADRRVKRYEASLTSLLRSTGIDTQLNQSFNDMIKLLQTERAKLLDKLKTVESALETAEDESTIVEHQIRFLSKDLSKYKRQNRDILRALSEITNDVDACSLSGTGVMLTVDGLSDESVEQSLSRFKQLFNESRR